MKFLVHPARPILVVLFLLVDCSSTDTIKEVDDARIVSLEQRVLELVNEHRRSKGLPKLMISDVIVEQARSHSRRMARGIVPVGHDGFNGRVGEISRRVRYQAAAENVGFNQGYPHPAEIVFRGWLESQEHRENIEGKFDLTGIGVSRSNNNYYFTQIFILSS